MYFSRFKVAFDDGNTCEAQACSRDMLTLEKQGVKLEPLGGTEASYVIVYTVLQRMARKGLLDFTIPATLDEFMDVADILPVEDEDPEGNGSGQDRITG